MANYNTINMDDEFMSRNVTERKEKKKKDLAMADAPVWPMDKWPHSTPGQGPLPNTKLPKKKR